VPDLVDPHPLAKGHPAMPSTPTSRQFHALAASAGLALSGVPLPAAESKKRMKVAAIFTAFTYRSHAHVLLENFLESYLFNGQRTDPGVDVVSFFADQAPPGQMAVDVAREYKIPIYRSIDEALCLGGKELAVDAVLSIGEHGQYPTNKLGQVEYPRKRFFDAIVAVMQRSERSVPLFSDKHLSYRWDWAKEMVDTATKLHIPFMAGSSVPLAQRISPLELPVDADITEAVSVHGGGLESYDFHALEILQSLIEARKGGETGIAAVQFLTGDALWQAGRDRRWSLELAEAALAVEGGSKPISLKKLDKELAAGAHGILLTYRNGFRAFMLKIGQSSTRWDFACRLKGESAPVATRFHVGPWQNRNLFNALAHAIQQHIRSGKAPYPVERTLLVSGVLDASMHSRAQAGQEIKTPHLEFAYQSRDFKAMREMGESWKIVTDATPEPMSIDHGCRAWDPKSFPGPCLVTTAGAVPSCPGPIYGTLQPADGWTIGSLVPSGILEEAWQCAGS
jgi:hypothetical protein